MKKIIMGAIDIESYQPITKDREKELWEDCIFVFDTSALLEFYYFSEATQQEIFNSTLSKLTKRLWVPGHVHFEYLKNRETTLKKPIEEKYKRLETDHIQAIENNIKNMKDKLNDFINNTKKSDIHPYINNDISDKFKNICQEFEENFSKFKDDIKTEFKSREDEIYKFVGDDTVKKAIEKYFEFGQEYSFDKILQIVSEGEIRYRNEIPPGFKDASRKEGTQKYGDLIIWKQIIEYACKKEKPIVFITNDVTKNDWCYHNKRGNELRIERPKEDLIKEIKDTAEVDFWMYSFSQFLYVAREIMNTNINQEILDEVIEAVKPKVDYSKYISFNGYYRTYDIDDEDSNEFVELPYYYRFDQDGTVVYEAFEGTSTTGFYVITPTGHIHMEFEKFTMTGKITKRSLVVSWTNDNETGNNFGAERGAFVPD